MQHTAQIEMKSNVPLANCIFLFSIVLWELSNLLEERLIFFVFMERKKDSHLRGYTRRPHMNTN